MKMSLRQKTKLEDGSDQKSLRGLNKPTLLPVVKGNYSNRI